MWPQHLLYSYRRCSHICSHILGPAQRVFFLIKGPKMKQESDITIMHWHRKWHFSQPKGLKIKACWIIVQSRPHYPMFKARFMQKCGVQKCTIPPWLPWCFLTMSLDKSKNPCLCRNCTFPNEVHHLGLGSTRPKAKYFPKFDDAQSGHGHKFLLYFWMKAVALNVSMISKAWLLFWKTNTCDTISPICETKPWYWYLLRTMVDIH